MEVNSKPCVKELFLGDPLLVQGTNEDLDLPVEFPFEDVANVALKALGPETLTIGRNDEQLVTVPESEQENREADPSENTTVKDTAETLSKPSLKVEESSKVVPSLETFTCLLENSCELCPSVITSNRECIAFGAPKEGPAKVKVLFVAEGPSLQGEESPQGAFKKESLELLSKMAMAIGLEEKDFGYTLLRKCSSKNEDWESEEKDLMLSECDHWWKQELKAYRPQFIFSLGAAASGRLLGKKERLGKVHGKFFAQSFALGEDAVLDTTIVPLFHPDYLLANPTMKKTVWRDLQKIIPKL